MTTHRFDLGPATGRGMVTPCHYLGAEVLRSHAPIYDAARWLLDHGHAAPSDTVETWRGGMRCMSGTVGRVAAWTVTEADREGLRMVRWADVQAKRSRLAALQAETAVVKMATAEPNAQHGGDREAGKQASHTKLGHGETSDYIASRIKRDHPDIAEAVEGRFPHHGAAMDGQTASEGNEVPSDHGTPSLAPSHADLIAELSIAA